MHSAQVLEPTPFKTTLAMVIGQLMPRFHYSSQPLDSELSARIFDAYFSSLDRERRFFLASDIDEFSVYRERLHTMILTGNLNFPFLVHQRYLQRFEERVEFVRRTIEQPFDFDTEQVILTDRSQEPWAENRDELDQVWRRHIKNRLLLYRLTEARETDASEENKDGGEEEVPEDDARGSGRTPDSESAAAEQATSKSDSAIQADQRSHEERVLEHYERMLEQLHDSENIDVLENFLNALTRTYDPHSAYMAPAREEDFAIEMSLSLEGIGAVLSTDEGYVEIVEIIPGGPADRDGRLQVGDRIVGVSRNDEMVNVINMPLRRAVRLIRGSKGSEVRLQVLEAGRGLGAMPTVVELVRDRIQLTAQQARSEWRHIELPDRESLLGGESEPSAATSAATDGEGRQTGEAEQAHVLVVSLPSFYADFSAQREGDENYRQVSRDLRELLLRAREAEEGLDGVVLDLRYNGGGSLEEAIKVAGLFLTGGPVVQRSAGKAVVVLSDEDEESLYEGPLVVVVNKLSASASEIVAAAIQDHGRGIVVGDSGTYGKGTVQHIYNLSEFFSHHPFFSNEAAGSLKFTMAKFYRISGDSVQKRGVVPNISLPAFTDHLEIGEANLDGSLPWDQIDSVLAEDQVEDRWQHHLPLLQERSRQRVEQDPELQRIKEISRRHLEIQEMETRPLNWSARQALHEEEEQWFETIRAETMRRRRYRPRDNNDDESRQNEGQEEETPSDPHLQEALRVLADMICLDRNQPELPQIGH